eukprot:8882246-Alexandrium_andersonii.AAC.1
MRHGSERCAHWRHDGDQHEYSSEVVQDPVLVVSPGKIHSQNEIEIWSRVHVASNRHAAGASLAAADFGEVHPGLTARVHMFKLIQGVEMHRLQM